MSTKPKKKKKNAIQINSKVNKVSSEKTTNEIRAPNFRYQTKLTYFYEFMNDPADDGKTENEK